MTQEQKAKAYDEAIKKAKDMLSYKEVRQEDIEYLFPELKESKDERISKAIHIYLDWLDGRKDYAPKGEYTIRDMIAWLKKQGEQKPADKVEPKFKVEKGKWYVCNTARYTDFIVGKAYYCPKNGMLKPNETEIARYVASDCFRLWTIQDVKDGDVLVDEDSNIGIYKEIDGIYWDSYIYLICNGKLKGFGIGGSHKQANTRPATKEQRDTLMKAMADAGYTFDFEKKELNKIV